MTHNRALMIKSSKSSIRKKLLFAFFIVLAISGIIINIIFVNVIHRTLSAEGLAHDIILNVSRHFTVIGAVVTIAGILIVLLIALFISDKITRPIKKLTEGMLDIGNGKLDIRIDLSGNDEIGQLADGFNLMAAQINDSMRMLKTSKEYTDNIVRSVPSILIVLSNRLNVLSTNTALERLQEQYPGLSISQFTSLLNDEILRNLENGEPSKKEISLIPEGTDVSIIFSATVSGIGDIAGHEDEEKASVLLTITNVTESRKMKEMVLQSRQDWEDTFNTIPDMITIHDKDYNVLLANRAAKEMLKIPAETFRKMNKCYELYHGTQQAPDGCPSCNCLESGEQSTFEIYEPHLGRYVEIRSIPRFGRENELIGLIHIVRDISLRKKIEDEHNKLMIAITKAKMEWEMTFDSVMEYIILIDSELRITRCNKSFAGYVKQPASSVIDNHCYDFFHCSNLQIEDCRNRMGCGRELTAKNELETENGRWLYISHRPIQDEREKLLKSVIIATDITELKHAQKRIKVSENELKKKVNDLEKFYDMAVGREVRMKELKKEIKRLNRKLADYEEIHIAQ